MSRVRRFPKEQRSLFLCTAILFASLSAAPAAPQDAVRARDLGIPFEGRPGPLNAVTDVPGVEVGHATLIEGEGPLVVGGGPVRTGVTAIFPLGKNATEGVAAGWFSFNGAGEMTRVTVLDKLGVLFGPVMLTNTLSVGTVQAAVVEWRRRRHIEDPGALYTRPLHFVAGAWDGFLNDIYGQHVTREDVFHALDTATGRPVEEGNVGGGTGMRTFEFKSGIGTSSRSVNTRQGRFLLGVLVQSNFGRRYQMRVAGVPVGKELTGFMPESATAEEPQGNSIIVVVATDAPLLPGQLERVARRAALGFGRSGSIGMAGSTDIFLAFSTASRMSFGDEELRQVQGITDVNPLFEATVQATEEAIINALVAGERMEGVNGNVVHALPHGSLLEVLSRYNRHQIQQSVDDILNEVQKVSFLLPYASGKKIFVTEYFTLQSLLRKPARGVIFLTAMEYRGDFWDIPVNGYSAPAMAAERGFFAYTTDYLGIGKSYRPEKGSTVDYRSNAEPISKLIERIQHYRRVERVDLVGEGHGGEVASALADDPKSVRSVVMSTMYYKKLGVVKKRFTEGFRTFLSNRPNGYWTPNVMSLTLTHVGNPEIRDYVFFSQRDLEVPTGPFLQHFDSGPLFHTAKEARVPALILIPEFSGWANPSDIIDLETDWGGGANLVILQGGHHVPRIESTSVAQSYFRELFRFLDP